MAFDDPIVYTSTNGKRVDSKYFLKPIQDEVLARIKGAVALGSYGVSYTCGAGDAVGDPVRISGNNTVTLALGTTAANAKVFGFISHKGPRGAASVAGSTSCVVVHYYYKSGLSGLTAGNPVYLSNTGTISATAGTSAKVLGEAISTTEAILYADGVNALYASSLFLDSEGDPANVNMSAASDGTSIYAARRDHVHLLADAAVTQAKLAVNARCGPNHLINGAFRVMQRTQTTHNTFFTTATSAGNESYVWDRWKLATEGASLQATRYDTNTGGVETGLASRFYAKLRKITGAGKVMMRQILTGSHTAGLHGRQVTFQIKMKSDTARTMRIAIVELNSSGTIDTIPTDEDLTTADATDITFGTNTAKITVDSVVNCTSANTGGTCSVTTSWQLFAITCTIPSNSKNIMCCVWSDSNIAISGSNQDIYIAEAGLYDGGSIRDYVPEDEEAEVQRCQPFCEKSFALDTVPAQNAGAGTVYAGLFLGSQTVAASTAGTMGGHVHFRARKISTAPTITLYNPGAASAEVYNYATATSCTSTSYTSTDQGFYVNTTSPGGSAIGQLLGIHWLAEAEL